MSTQTMQTTQTYGTRDNRVEIGNVLNELTPVPQTENILCRTIAQVTFCKRVSASFFKGKVHCKTLGLIDFDSYSFQTDGLRFGPIVLDSTAIIKKHDYVFGVVIQVVKHKQKILYFERSVVANRLYSLVDSLKFQVDFPYFDHYDMSNDWQIDAAAALLTNDFNILFHILDVIGMQTVARFVLELSIFCRSSNLWFSFAKILLHDENIQASQLISPELHIERRSFHAFLENKKILTNQLNSYVFDYQVV